MPCWWLLKIHPLQNDAYVEEGKGVAIEIPLKLVALAEINSDRRIYELGVVIRLANKANHLGTVGGEIILENGRLSIE